MIRCDYLAFINSYLIGVSGQCTYSKSLYLPLTVKTEKALLSKRSTHNHLVFSRVISRINKYLLWSK